MTRRDDIIRYARSFLGRPYIWGGNNPLIGFDCSGFACEVLRAHGVIGDADMTAAGLALRFPVATAGLPAGGELLFFGAARNITHVALALPELRMIEAGGGNSSTNTLEIAIAKNAFVRERMINHRNDFVGWAEYPGVAWK